MARSEQLPPMEVFPDGYTEAEIQESYRQAERRHQKYLTTLFIGKTLRWAVRPKVSFEDQEAVEAATQQNLVRVLVSDHKHLLDPFVTVAAVMKDPVLRQIQETRWHALRRGGDWKHPNHTRPMAKIPLFKASDPYGRYARPLLSTVAATHIARDIDSDTELGHYSRRQAMALTERNLVRGINSLSFPQGTRSEIFDPDTAKKGISAVAVNAATILEYARDIHEAAPAGVVMMPFAVGYDRMSTTDILNPLKSNVELRFATPILVEPGMDDVEVLHEQTTAAIVRSVEYLEEEA